MARLALPLLACIALLPPALSHGEGAHTSVIGGDDAEAGEYRWQIALYQQPQGPFLPSFICGGTLIAPQRVVTAAHCVSGKASSLRVLAGTQVRSTSGPFINVSSYEIHPSNNQHTLDFDVAILRLASSGLDAGGLPLQLIDKEPSSEDEFWEPGKSLAISGWGRTLASSNQLPTQLQEARVPRVLDSTCGQPDYNGTDFHPSTMLCAGFDQGGVDTCSGDSGGPLAASIQDPPPVSENDPSKWRLAGITSWGFGCAEPKKPGVYARVAAPAIHDWILDTSSLVTLTVSVSGSGNGTVTSANPAQISCPSDCTEGYPSGTSVILSAAPAPGSIFTGWGGACSGTGGCTVTMDAAKTVTAGFANTSSTPVTRTLTVVKQGDGIGTVTSNPVGINCGSDCSQGYPNGTAVTLTATPAAGNTFVGWDGGGCSGSGTCTVSMTQVLTVTATFGIQQQLPTEPPDDSGPGSDEPPVTADDTPPVAAITSNRLRMNERGFVHVRIDCGDSPEDCLGKVEVWLRLPGDDARTRVGHAEFDIAAGDSERVKLRLRRRARRFVRREGEVRAKVVAIVEDAAGNTDKLKRKLPLIAPGE